MSYFFDTYAFVEMSRKNPAFLKYTRTNIVTTRMNLLELHYTLLRTNTEEYAEATYDTLRKFCFSPDDDTLKEASKFRRILRKRKVSFVDCIGYIIAKRLGIPFLTGDKEFKGMENVEFVQ